MVVQVVPSLDVWSWNAVAFDVVLERGDRGIGRRRRGDLAGGGLRRVGQCRRRVEREQRPGYQEHRRPQGRQYESESVPGLGMGG